MSTKQNVFVRVKRKFADLKISTKILTFYSAIMLFSVLVSAFFYQSIYNSTMSKKVSDVSVQTLYSISSNIYSMIENAKNLSKVIIASDEIQQPLRGSQELIETGGIESGTAASSTLFTGDVTSQRIINTHISKFIDAFPFISSIYIFDNTSQRYGIDKMPLKSLLVENIAQANWYQAAVNAKGGFVLRLNAGGVFSDGADEKYISLIRIINDIYTQKPLGVLTINISEDAFADSFKDILNKYDTDIMILDEEGQTIVDFKKTKLPEVDKLLKSSSESGNTTIKEFDGKDYLISLLNIPKYDWNIISTIPFQELSKESAIFNVIAFSITAINAFLLFFGSIALSRMISYPIKKLLKSMKGVERGEFKKVDIEAGNDEIGKLRDAYNIMITEIQNLIKKVVHEEKIKRKAELDVLQAQIKPHFLYNTFDAISSLALSGQNEQVYKVMKSLGSYYRVSLSKGSEVITISEELDVVRNYMTIQQVRYGDIFTLHYDIDESATRYKILKLVLQPLVENALYHGIKPKGEKGAITLSLKLIAGMVELTVEDDGVGMDQEAITQILDDRYQGDNKTSFGLRGTIERLRLFYGINDPVSIESAKNKGTKVIIHVPVEREGENVG